MTGAIKALRFGGGDGDGLPLRTLRAFAAQQRAAGVPVHARAALVALKALALLGYARGRKEGACAVAEPVPVVAADTAAVVSSVVRQGPALKAAASRPSQADGELVAVVVPVLLPAGRGRRPALRRLAAGLAALAAGAQTRPPDLVVVVDDGSAPPLAPLAPLMAPVELPLTQLALAENRGPAAARNAGLAAAAGATLVLFTDADCEPSAGWAAAHVAAQAAARGVVSGMTAAVARGLVSRFHDACGTLNARLLPATGGLLYGCTCNLSVAVAPPAAAAANGTGGSGGTGGTGRSSYAPPPGVLAFDESFRAAAFEDVDLCRRAAKAGLPLTAAPAARVRHAFAASPGGVFRQFRRYGASEARLAAKHPEYLGQLGGSVELPARGA